MWSLAIAMVLGSAQASDVEVGVDRKFGLGVAAGFPPSATAKYFFNRRNGLALHVGPTLASSGLHTRLQFEQTAATLRTWDLGELGFVWNIGIVVNYVFGQSVVGRPVRPGVTAGVGIELALAPVPAVVFAEASPVIFPLDIAPKEQSPFLPAGITIAIGARWHF